MVSVISYDEGRLRRALVNSGVEEQGLERYIQRASDSKLYYSWGDDQGGQDDLAVDVLGKKYLAPGETGPLQMWDRIARAIASVETPENQERIYLDFFNVLKDFKLVPGGRIMHGAGRTEARREPTLSNCYVIPITWGYSQDVIESLEEVLELGPEKVDDVRKIVMDARRSGMKYNDVVNCLLGEELTKLQLSKLLYPADSLDAIYQNMKEAALVYRSGGGVGTDLSALRPKGTSVNSTMDTAPGAVEFMNILSESTETVAQHGRRGALMLTLRVDHPDIEHFITIKDDPERTRVQHANISVLLTNEFMEAVECEREFRLHWENEDPLNLRYGKVEERSVNAKELFDKIVRHAHSSAEPGLIFWDAMREYHNGEYMAPLESTNPCGEQPLAPYTSCNLSNLNLTAFVTENGKFDFDSFITAVRVSTRFLDDVVEYNTNNHALHRIRTAVANDRRIGLGVTGLKYDNEMGLETVENIMRTMRDEAYRTSIELAREKGAFPAFVWEGYSRSKFVQSLPEEIRRAIEREGIRNVTVLTMPPVGTGSIVTQTSSGIEPIFATGYDRTVKQGDRGDTKKYRVYHPLVRRLFGTDENLPPYVVTAHKIDPFFRVRMQRIIQKYVDTSISSTINLPEDTSVETVAQIYMDSWKQGLKGVTVYREGSRRGVLETSEHAGKSLEQKVNGYVHPRTRPPVTTGVTERIRTGEGNLYVTINEDDRGICEVFSAIGKAGGNAAAQSEAISRLISLALRSGIDPGEVVEQLIGISGPVSVWEDGELILSTPDALGKALRRHLQRKGFNSSAKNSGVQLLQQGGDGKGIALNGTCPECGSSVQMETGCVTCLHCGWTKC